jgi:hypothetical protein
MNFFFQFFLCTLGNHFLIGQSILYILQGRSGIFQVLLHFLCLHGCMPQLLLQLINFFLEGLNPALKLLLLGLYNLGIIILLIQQPLDLSIECTLQRLYVPSFFVLLLPQHLFVHLNLQQEAFADCVELHFELAVFL